VTDTLQRNDENEQAYMQLIADYVQADKLLPFDRSGYKLFIGFKCMVMCFANEVA
jgi:predicted ATP-dependent protease